MPSSPPTFVDGLDLSGTIRTGLTRHFHRKSRTGCQKCRARRVKCDETKPHCRNCIKHGSDCIYDRPDRNVIARATRRSNHAPPSNPGDVDADEPGESMERRMAELELMHFYVTETGPSIPFDKETSHNLYVKAIPRMALKSTALLYSLFAMAALHKSRSEHNSEPKPEATNVRDEHELYSRLAFQHHRREVSNMEVENMDLLFMTGNLMRLMASFILSQRVLEPYSPPVEWLRITKSHYKLYETAWSMVGDDHATQTSAMIQSTFQDWREITGSGSATGPQRFGHLLKPLPGVQDDPSLWDPPTREAYTSTVTYICELCQSAERKDHFPVIARRIIIFPVMVDANFVALVEEAKPRALVVLAHYFALLTMLSEWWYVGDTGIQEITALAKHLSPPWDTLLEWPLRVVREGV